MRGREKDGSVGLAHSWAYVTQGGPDKTAAVLLNAKRHHSNGRPSHSCSVRLVSMNSSPPEAYISKVIGAGSGVEG